MRSRGGGDGGIQIPRQGGVRRAFGKALADKATLTKTIVLDDQLAGHILSFMREEKPEIAVRADETAAVDAVAAVVEVQWWPCRLHYLGPALSRTSETTTRDRSRRSRSILIYYQDSPPLTPLPPERPDTALALTVGNYGRRLVPRPPRMIARPRRMTATGTSGAAAM
jgi:hypothetical protein